MLVRLMDYDIVCERIVHLTTVQLLLIQSLIQLLRPLHECRKKFIPRVYFRSIMPLPYTASLSCLISIILCSLFVLLSQKRVHRLVI